MTQNTPLFKPRMTVVKQFACFNPLIILIQGGPKVGIQ